VPPATPAGKVNVTDPDSRNVKTPRGYLQGYNAQAVCNVRWGCAAPAACRRGRVATLVAT
jgi:hypothetical protein